VKHTELAHLRQHVDTPHVSAMRLSTNRKMKISS
jgi:hypothetical protein